MIQILQLLLGLHLLLTRLLQRHFVGLFGLAGGRVPVLDARGQDLKNATTKEKEFDKYLCIYTFRIGRIKTFI